MHKYVKIISSAAGVSADQTGLVGLVYGRLHVGWLIVELAANVNVCSSCAHSAASNQTALDKLVRIVSHDFSVLAGAWLALVGVYDQILWSTVGRLVHEAPLEAAGEAGAAATSQTRHFDLVDYPVGALLENLLGFVPVASRERAFQLPVVSAIQVREYAILVFQSSELGLGLFGRHPRLIPNQAFTRVWLSGFDRT